MRDLFPGWVPPDEETLESYWDEATFAVDTSVLLDLYRFSEEARNGLLRALQSVGEQLWIPHQVGLEFHRNRLGVLLDQREAESNLLRELDQIHRDLDKQLSQLLRGAGRRDLAPLREAVDNGFESLREKLKEAEKEHTKGLGDSIRDDPIYEEVVQLCADRVGLPFPEERQALVIRDGEERFRTKTPPGYLDDEKDTESKYGDVILWHQLCDRASETEKPMVLIADDRKADWVWEVRGKTIGPRPELVAEMSDRAGVGFHLYTPTRFLEMWKSREAGREVAPEVLAEISDSTTKKSSAGIDVQSLAEQLYALKKGKKPPLYLSQKERPSRVAHLVGAEQVELLLELKDAVDNPDAVAVSLQTPNGDYDGALASLVTSLSGSTTYLAQFPRDFKESSAFMPGEYVVVWHSVFHGKGAGEGHKVLAIDSFQIGDSDS